MGDTESPPPLESPPLHPRILGHPGNTWYWTQATGFDLTHRPFATSPYPATALRITITNSSVTLDTTKTALVIVDMQNISLSPSLGRPQAAPDVAARLFNQTIPSVRKVGTQIVHTTWGLEDADMAAIDPTSFRNFALGPDLMGMENPTIGDELGPVRLESGPVVGAGRMLFKDTWNTELWPPLDKEFQRSQEMARPDVRFHRIRLSGFYSGKTDLKDWLVENGFRTLLFAGVQTDACVLISLQEANLAGFDAVLLKDVSSTARGRGGAGRR